MKLVPWDNGCLSTYSKKYKIIVHMMVFVCIGLLVVLCVSLFLFDPSRFVAVWKARIAIRHNIIVWLCKVKISWLVKRF